MEFKFYLPTKVIMGRQCIKDNTAELKLGNNALIVIGNSAKKNGSLDDVVAALEREGISYCINDKTEVNPSLESVTTIGDFARENGVDFVIGIGGGSVLDTAKAVAVLAVNDIEAEALYTNVFKNKPLPVVTVPTTAGTGSEVTPYAVLTVKTLDTKKSFGNSSTSPVIAFLDATYTEMLPAAITIDSAIDSLSHAVEGYLTKQSTPLTDLLALEAVRLFAKNIEHLKSGNHSFQSREELLYAAMLSGIVIIQARTLAVHAMGYALTYFRDIPHGTSNGLLLEKFLEYSYDHSKEKIDTLLDVMGLHSIGELGLLLDSLLKNNLPFTAEELKKYTSIVCKAAIGKANPRQVCEESIYQIYHHSLCRE